VQRAESAAESVLQRARGESGAFLRLFEAQAGAPELFRLRARFEAAEKALSAPELVLVLDPRIELVPVERKQAAASEAKEPAPRPWEKDD
jgi:hypothetical protein